MIHYFNGSVFNSPAKTLVNTVNCIGVMGAGIALEFKLRFPEMFNTYKTQCENDEMNIGRPKLYKYSQDIWILNFPTKKHWRHPSKLNYIEEGLKYFVQNYKKAEIETIAFPKLGSNKGGLDWPQVKKTMESYLQAVDIDVYICLDEKKEAEGTEREMLDKLNSSNVDDLISEIELSKKQTSAVINNVPVDRFWEIGTKKGIGEKTYEKLFRYFYLQVIDKKPIYTQPDKNNDSDFEQLSLF